MKKIKVVLISKMEDTLYRMRQIINDEEIDVIGDSSGGSNSLDYIENTSPDIVIMSMTSGDMDVLSLAERIIQYKPRSFVILLFDKINVELLKKALDVGAHNVIEFPTSQKEFAEYIKSVYNSESQRIQSLTESQSIAWNSKVITVFGSKGGLGKTTIATNLAIKLAEARKKVALVDLDLQFGDVHIFLDIEPKDTIAELVQEVFAPNIDSVRSYMTIHSTGVHVLCAPKSPEYAEVVSADRIQSLLRIMRSYYDYVIIDTPPMFNDTTITAIEASSTILFVTGLDISILKNSKLSMTLLDSLKQKDKVSVIINRAVEINTITIADVQRIIDAPILSTIPSDYMVAVSALNRGVPFVIGAPNCKLSQAISDIANILMSNTMNYDIQKLNPKERKKLLKKYKSTERSKKFFALRNKKKN
ncbi:MAG: AAA family ATPase [Lachnospiraceae bacterium]|nr:AAA family ATPase [Lachnospiraceae bacterium]